MRLSDVVGGAGLSVYAEIALLIFFVVFVAVVMRVFFTTRAGMDQAARLPFDDEAPSPSSAPRRAD
jgi:cbb3-type cytochrome oxidase subunit 3